MVIRRSLSWRSLSVSARTYVRSDCNEFLISATSGQAGQDAVDAAGQFSCQYQNVFCVCAWKACQNVTAVRNSARQRQLHDLMLK